MNLMPAFKVRSLLVAVAAALTLAACGGGGGDAAAPAPAPAPAVPPIVIPEPPAGGFAPSGPTAAPAAPSDAQAVRFLAQSTFGATSAEIDRLKRLGYNDWIEQQFQIPRTSHLDFVLGAYPIPTPEGVTVTIDPLYQSFWKQAITGPDPLRQRVTYALSQILVTSAADAALQTAPHTLASYLDTLSTHAFGNYRDLLEAVTKHPAMGQYLTSLGNRGDGGRVPDENYAREVMQLFSIGLVQLNTDGTPEAGQRRAGRHLQHGRHPRSGPGVHRLGLGQHRHAGPGQRSLRRQQSAGSDAARDTDAVLRAVSLAARKAVPRRDGPRRYCRPAGAEDGARHARSIIPMSGRSSRRV